MYGGKSVYGERRRKREKEKRNRRGDSTRRRFEFKNGVR